MTLNELDALLLLPYLAHITDNAEQKLRYQPFVNIKTVKIRLLFAIQDSKVVQLQRKHHIRFFVHAAILQLCQTVRHFYFS